MLPEANRDNQNLPVSQAKMPKQSKWLTMLVGLSAASMPRATEGASGPQMAEESAQFFVAPYP